MRYEEIGSWSSGDKFFKVTISPDENEPLLYDIKSIIEVNRASKSSLAMGMYASANHTAICNDNELIAISFGGINTTFGGLMGKTSNEIIRYEIKKSQRNKQTVQMKILTKYDMNGDIPLPAFEANLHISVKIL